MIKHNRKLKMEFKVKENAKNTSNNYDKSYFIWQNRSGINGFANSYLFKKFIKPEDTVVDFGVVVVILIICM